MQVNDLTVVCVCTIDPSNWKRPVYSKIWVDRLYRAVNRNLNIPFEFVCMSNDLNPQDCDYRIQRLNNNAWGWWNKLEMFRTDLFKGPCLYIDIDNVICKNITDVISELPMDKMLMPREPYKNILNSSVIFWSGDYGYLYDEYVKNQKDIIDRYQFATEQRPSIGDQGFIKDCVENLQAFDDYAPNNFFGWKHHIAGTKIDDPSMLVFTSNEKPTNNLDLDLVKLNWI